MKFDWIDRILIILGIIFVLLLGNPDNAQANGPNKSFSHQVHCMATNLYHEARNQPELGQRAVASVVMNRVNDSRFPDTVCKVVYQAAHDNNGNPIRHSCQFSWYCDGKPDDIREDLLVYTKLVKMAFYILASDKGNSADITGGSTHYHSDKVNPYWAIHKERVVQIDNHIFYRWN